MTVTIAETEKLDPNDVKAGIISEIEDLKRTAQSFGLQAIKDGTWFNSFVRSCLEGYNKRVIDQGGAEYLRSKYPGLPTDAVAEKLCELAEKYAALAGGVSGAAASVVVVSAGAGIPTAIVAVMGEVLYTVRLQLRLVYDLHLVYSIPLDTDDPEDLMAIFATVYGVKLTEVGGISAKALGPEVVRAQLYRLVNGNTEAIKAAVRALLGPRIANKVTQRAILKTAVPVAGVLISAGWNYGSTRIMGARVRHAIRTKAALREETVRLQRLTKDLPVVEHAVLDGLLALACVDNGFDDREREVYLAFLEQLGLTDSELKALASRVNADVRQVCVELASINDPACREAIARCFCLIVVADGVTSAAEIATLSQMLAALGQIEMLHLLPDLGKPFRRSENLVEQALGSIGDAAAGAGEKVGKVAGQAMGWMRGVLGKDKPPAHDEEVLVSEESEEQRVASVLLGEMDKLSKLFASGQIDQSTYEARVGSLLQATSTRPSGGQ